MGFNYGFGMDLFGTLEQIQKPPFWFEGCRFKGIDKKMTEIPETIKEDNWRLFEQAMSPDPSIAAQYSLKLVTHLQVTMEIGEITEYNGLLIQAKNKAREALAQYSADTEIGHEGYSLQTVSEVVGLIGILLYDDRFTTRDKNAFTGRG